MVAYLQKSKGSEEFHQIIDFLNVSHIQYALTENPTIYVSFIMQFWRTTTARTSANGEVELTATIDGQVKTITESSLRRHLKLEDNGGVTTLPNSEIFEQLALMGYVTDSDKLTFQKGYFSPQWKFLIYTILHCLNPKKTAWEQFSSNIATAMIKNLENPHKYVVWDGRGYLSGGKVVCIGNIDVGKCMGMVGEQRHGMSRVVVPDLEEANALLVVDMPNGGLWRYTLSSCVFDNEM
ncbi:hypothetical protein Tco_0922206 [Tanacetum coccineum]|uniref:Uncharacterized protein n=1 Tax=Tanacetum coccineum TaxID=301880 RepID=A0ABQ5D077_9ASTR